MPDFEKWFVYERQRPKQTNRQIELSENCDYFKEREKIKNKSVTLSKVLKEKKHCIMKFKQDLYFIKIFI